MTWSLHLLWIAHQFMSASSLQSLLLKASQWSFSTLNHHHFKVGKVHSAAVRPHQEHHFRTVSYPGPLQTANLPVESCWALKSCNTEHFHFAQVCQPNWFLIRAITIRCYQNTRLHQMNNGGSCATYVAWCPGPPAAPEFFSAEASTAGLKTVGKCYRSRQTNRETIW